MSLRGKILLSFFLLTVIPVVVMGCFSYRYFYDVLLSNIQQRELQNNNQIIYSIDEFLQLLSKISDSLLMSKPLNDILKREYSPDNAVLQKYRDRAEAADLLYRNGIYLNDHIETVAVFPENSDLIYFSSKKDVWPGYDVRKESWYQDIVTQAGGQAVIGVHKNHMLKSDNIYSITLARCIYEPYSAKLLGTILIDVDVTDLRELWQKNVKRGSEIFFLIDDQNNVIYSNVPNSIGNPSGFEDGLCEGITSQKKDGVLYDVLVSESRKSGWKAVNMVARSELAKELSFVPYVTILFSIILSALSVLVALFISQMITRPLQELYVRMKQFEIGKSGKSHQEYKVEVKELSNSYNQMIEKIHMLTEKNYKTEIQLQKAELMALQSQVNPHFVYNTLNSIKWMADMQGAKRMVTALDSLIKLLIFSSKTSQDMISIDDEISLVKDYINLLNLKYFDKVSVFYHVAPGVGSCKTLKFLLQPIVENSIYHGFKDLQHPCEIKINIERIADRICYEVLDNGKGMTPEEIEHVLSEEHLASSNSFNKIGLYNVNKRIQYIFGNTFGIKIDSVLGEYTRVLVEIPALSFTEEEADDGKGTDRHH